MKSIQNALAHFNRDGRLVGQNEDKLGQTGHNILEFAFEQLMLNPPASLDLAPQSRETSQRMWRKARLETIHIKKNRAQPWGNILEALRTTLNLVAKKKKVFDAELTRIIHDLTTGADMDSFIVGKTDWTSWTNEFVDEEKEEEEEEEKEKEKEEEKQEKGEKEKEEKKEEKQEKEKEAKKRITPIYM